MNRLQPGKYTVATAARTLGTTSSAAIMRLHRLRQRGLVETSGGGRIPRIYTITTTPVRPTNGFYDLVNRYAPEKIVPGFAHYVHGRYTTEQAIIDGLRLGDARTLDATKHLFRHVTDWKRLFALAQAYGLETQLHALYGKARQETRVRRMPARYA